MGVAAAVAGAVRPTADLTTHTDSLTQGFNNATAAAAALDGEVTKLTGVHVSATRAAIDWESKLAAAKTTLAETGATTDITSEKGRTAIGVILDMIDSTGKQVSALEKEGASSRTVRNAYDDHVEALRNVMSQAGFTTDQIEALIDQYGILAAAPDITKNITTNHYEDTYVSRHETSSGTAFRAAGGMIGQSLAWGGEIRRAAAGYTSGFETSGPTLVGEGNPAWHEFVIATDPQYHARNVDLWMKAGKGLGLMSGDTGPSGGSYGSPIGGAGITFNAPVTVIVQGATGTEAARDFQAQLLRYQRANGPALNRSS
jgi:hypothetical protein